MRRASGDKPPYTNGVLATTVSAPWGVVHLAASGRGIVALEMTSTREAFVEHLERRFGGAPRWLAGARDHGPAKPDDEAAAGFLATAVTAIEAAVNANPGTRAPELIRLPVDLSDRPAWDRAVLEAVRAIPRGEVRSYGQIARAVDRPGAARAVGGAVGRNPVALLIPCHRVVAGDGSLGGYGGGWWGDHERLLDLKAELLAREGVSLPRSHAGGRRRR